MEVRLSTDLKIEQSQSITSISNLKSFLRGNSCDDNSFQVESIHQKVVEIAAGSDIPSSIDVFDFFSLDVADVTFVHIQIYNTQPEEYSDNDINFSLQLGGVDMGNHSLFSLYNMSNFTSTVVVSSVTVPVSDTEPDKKAVLLIVVGAKN